MGNCGITLSVLTLAQDGGDQSTSVAPKDPRYPLDVGLGGTSAGLGLMKREKSLYPYWGTSIHGFPT
jgi:hypothetical protein